MARTTTPQEIQYWYILPAIRRAFSKEMARRKMKQKDIARHLGLTEAAVSQYVSAKRGDLVLPKDIIKEIKKSVDNVEKSVKDRAAFREVQRVSKQIMSTHAICTIHKRHDKTLPKDCDLCHS